MKHASIRLLMLALFIVVTGTAFSPKARVSPAKNAAKVAQCYYWFMEPADFIDDYADNAWQVGQMELFNGGLCNNNPIGGILVEYGYAQPTYPHNMNPQIGIYLHL